VAPRGQQAEGEGRPLAERPGPSTELRQWYGHDPARWPQFRKRYRAELKGRGDLLALLRYVTQERTVTFVYAASDEERNSAMALKEVLEGGKK
jgi:uncharacterized protein YeaO (DUF488 family)